MQRNKDKTKIGLEKYGSLTEFFIKGEGSLRIYETIATGISLVNSFFILTALSIYQFGLYQLVLSFIAIVSSLNFKLFDGMVGIEMRHIFNKSKLSSAKKMLKEYAFIKIFLSSVLAVMVFFASGFIAKYYGSDIGLFVKIISVLLVIEALISIETAFFKSIFSFSYFAIPLIRELLKLVILACFFFFGSLGVADVLGIHILGWLGALILTSFLFLKEYKKVFRKISSSSGSLLKNVFKKHGKWILLRHVFSRITKNTTPWLIKIFVSVEAVALYSLARNLVSLLEEIIPVNMFPWVFLSKIDKKEEMKYLFSRSTKYVIWLGLAIFVIGFFVFPFVINIILPKYNTAMPLFKLMLLVLPIFGFYKLLKGTLSVLREYKILALRVFTEGVVMIGTLVIFLPTIGVYGAVISYIAIYIARVIFFYPALIKAHPHFKLYFGDFLIFDKYDFDFTKKIGVNFLEIFKNYFSKLRFKNEANK